MTLSQHSRWLSTVTVMALLGLNPTLAQPLLLRTAAQDNNALKYDFRNPLKPGICVEVIRAIELLDPELRFSGWDTPMPLRRIEPMLAEGQLDAFCGLLRSSAREARFAFVEPPVYTVRHRIAVRADDAVNVQSFEDIRRLGAEGLVIAARSTAHEDWLRAKGGLLLDASSADTGVNLKKLVAKRGRFLYHTENALRRYIADEGLGDKVRLLPTIFKEEGLFFVVSNSLPPASTARLRTALEKLAKRGDLERIFAAYKEG